MHLRLKRVIHPFANPSRYSGFTLVELLIVMTILSILATIAVSSWLGFWNRFRLDQAREQVHQALKEAQIKARQYRLSWQASFRTQNNLVQWAVHAETTPAANITWHTLDESVRLDPETTLHQVGGVYRIQFDHDGRVNGRLGRLTLHSQSDTQLKRCVVVSTLLGAMRLSENQRQPDDGRFCY